MQSSSPSTIKVQAFIAHAGVASRRKAEELIAQGKVKVNGSPAHVGQRINPAKDEVTVSGKKIVPHQEHMYVLIYKPRGIISTTSDELNRKTVLSLVPQSKARLYPVGRLDKDSEGLMLLTTDGELTNTLTHPRYQIQKIYHVLIAGTPSTKALDHLRRGVKLKEGFTLPAQVEVVSHEQGNTWVSIGITEGRNRQVRRMLERVGYQTLRLIRVQLGPFTLDHLGNKQTRILTPEEVATLM